MANIVAMLIKKIDFGLAGFAVPALAADILMESQ
jgi:hypothetical protein